MEKFSCFHFADKMKKVAVVKCASYKQGEVDEAVVKALNLIGFDMGDYYGKKVLIKPNIVGCFPKSQIATTTHPSLIEAVCKILKQNKCEIFIGDSPFTRPEISYKAAGINRLKKYGTLVEFETSNFVKIRDDGAKVLKVLTFPKIVKDVDLVIDMPKLKTHGLTKYTGAIKNLYGCIPGGLKQRLHNEAQSEKRFAQLLVDIYQNIKPGLVIMDGVVGMEGEGPTSGESKKSGLVLASENAVALDIAATQIIGYKPKKILMIKEAVCRKLYPGFKFELVGMKQLLKINFDKPTSVEMKKTRNMIKSLFKERPIVCDTKKCIKCGLCRDHCPVGAITLEPYPVIDRKKCIRCFCCIEICPRNALGLRK